MQASTRPAFRICSQLLPELCPKAFPSQTRLPSFPTGYSRTVSTHPSNPPAPLHDPSRSWKKQAPPYVPPLCMGSHVPIVQRHENVQRIQIIIRERNADTTDTHLKK